MGDKALLVTGLAAIFVALATLLGTIGALTSERAQVNRSLASMRAMRAAPEAMRREAQPPFSERVVAPLLRRFAGAGRALTPGAQSDTIRHRLEAAGSPKRWDAERVLAFKALGLLVLAVLGLFLPLSLGGSVLTGAGLMVVLGLAGYFAPDLWLYQLAYDRREAIQSTLPDALDLLTIPVEAG